MCDLASIQFVLNKKTLHHNMSVFVSAVTFILLHNLQNICMCFLQGKDNSMYYTHICWKDVFFCNMLWVENCGVWKQIILNNYVHNSPLYQLFK